MFCSASKFMCPPVSPKRYRITQTPSPDSFRFGTGESDYAHPLVEGPAALCRCAAPQTCPDRWTVPRIICKLRISAPRSIMEASTEARSIYKPAKRTPAKLPKPRGGVRSITFEAPMTADVCPGTRYPVIYIYIYIYICK